MQGRYGTSELLQSAQTSVFQPDREWWRQTERMDTRVVKKAEFLEHLVSLDMRDE